MKAKTVNDLFKLIKLEIEDGNGDRIIKLSNDDEGNDFHIMYYGFTMGEDFGDSKKFIYLG